MPSGKGNRIVKPRTAAQRDQAHAWGHEPIFAPKVEASAPDTSWWITPKTREDFDQAAKDQRERMQASAFGKVKGSPGTEG
jgi:hypothetical protein